MGRLKKKEDEPTQLEQFLQEARKRVPPETFAGIAALLGSVRDQRATRQRTFSDDATSLLSSYPDLLQQLLKLNPFASVPQRQQQQQQTTQVTHDALITVVEEKLAAAEAMISRMSRLISAQAAEIDRLRAMLAVAERDASESKRRKV